MEDLRITQKVYRNKKPRTSLCRAKICNRELCRLFSCCFFSRSFSCRCFSCRSFSGCSLTATTCALCLLLFLSHVFIVVNEFDESHVGTITLAEAKLDDTSVATGTVSHFLRDILEQFSNSEFVLQIAEDNAARVRCVVLTLGDERLNVLLQSLSLGESRSDSFVLDQRNCHIGKHCASVGCSTTQMVEFFIMSHFFECWLLRRVEDFGLSLGLSADCKQRWSLRTTFVVQLIVVQFVKGCVHPERQILALEQIIKLSE